ncbi:hypothetical protein [Vibrio mediterranei]|uniref:hypothetical protein n=1 Tax=Vibrio mediterranei TaxID=689 RepID=UPI00148D77F1|nr:hypothetical protein [Vibrio mediterranei]
MRLIFDGWYESQLRALAKEKGMTPTTLLKEQISQLAQDAKETGNERGTRKYDTQ